MKSTERHKLKENEFARSVARARDVVETRKSDIGRLAIAAVVIIALVGGYSWWRQSRNAKAEAALPKLMDAANRYPNADAGIAARYYAASALSALGRYPEAEQRFQEVVDKAGSKIYGRTARLGVAEAQVAQGKYDPAITIYREMSTDTKADLPADGVLMALARAYVQAGRKDEAARAFTRIVDEFPQSPYVADARRELEEVKKS